MLGGYDVAQICKNGHVINPYAGSQPEQNSKFCTDCSEPTITACEGCGADIQYDYPAPGVTCVGLDFPPPEYCKNCGQPYPWTKRSLDAANELINELEELNDEEKNQLSGCLPDLVSDTPRTQVAIHKFKRLTQKVSTAAWGMMKEILVNVVSESVMKQIQR